jgi:hypothetical protein
LQEVVRLGFLSHVVFVAVLLVGIAGRFDSGRGGVEFDGGGRQTFLRLGLLCRGRTEQVAETGTGRGGVKQGDPGSRFTKGLGRT